MQPQHPALAGLAPPGALGTFPPAQSIPSPGDPPLVPHPSGAEAWGAGRWANPLLCPRPPRIPDPGPHSPSEVRPGSCREFYARASRGNLDLLPRGSFRRTRLLRGALSCLVSGDGTGGHRAPPALTWRGSRSDDLSQGVRGSRLEPQQLGSLGAFLCELEPGSILTSDPAVLENLKLCPALTGAQEDALNALLLSGQTAHG